MCIDRIKLIAIMAEKRITSKAIAQATGISLSTISAVRNGKNCTRVVGNAIARALGVGISELLED